MITKEKRYAESFDSMTGNDAPALFTPLRIDREAIPEGLFAYDIREPDNGEYFSTIQGI